ncbi:hypothetical protein QCA50_014177 [Cerrena zonata]|uniref:Uncharacterized protein n=1 Tax=Cerrena zonata TaxID=2478898 RepID=A0AAW0FMC7_9APHY
MSKQGHHNASAGPPKYLQDFTKALASEVRILLQEVGKLRDERTQLQAEIAELMAVKAKQSGGGNPNVDFAGWLAKREPTPPPAPPTPPPLDDLSPARPGWRIVHKKPERRDRKKALPAPVPEAPPPPEAPPAHVPAWAQWRPNPIFSPQPKAGASTPMSAPMSPRAGLFGPPSPTPQ